MRRQRDETATLFRTLTSTAGLALARVDDAGFARGVPGEPNAHACAVSRGKAATYGAASPRWRSCELTFANSSRSRRNGGPSRS